MDWIGVYLGAGCVSFLISLFSTRYMISLAHKVGMIAYPREDRFHKLPTPLLGGVGIVAGILLPIVIGIFIVRFLPEMLPPPVARFLPGIYLRLNWIMVILTGTIFFSVLGLIDDRNPLGSLKKLIFQFIGAILTVLAGIRLNMFMVNKLWSGSLSVLWIVFILNIYNLIDNADGVCGGISIVASTILFFTAFMLKEYFICTILAVFIGAVGGFLVYNLHPARIFMGDCGSMVIGYMFAVISMLGTYYVPDSPTYFPVLIPVLVMMVPIFDTFSVIAIRLKNRKSIFKGDKNHFPHRLIRLGMTERTAVLTLMLLTLATGLPSVFLPFVDYTGVIIIFLQIFAILGVIALLEYYGGKSPR